MKYLKRYNESKIPDSLIQDCYDILLEVKDMGYKVFVTDEKYKEMRTIFVNGKMKDISDNFESLLGIVISRPLEEMEYSDRFCANKKEEDTMTESLDRLEDYLANLGWSKHPEGDEYIVRGRFLNIYYYK